MLVGISVGCLIGCFRAPPPRRETAPLKRPILGSMNRERQKVVMAVSCQFSAPQLCNQNFRQLSPTLSRFQPIPATIPEFISRRPIPRKRHINFEHINFLKVGTTLGQPAGQPEGKVYISCVSRRTHKLFGPVNPGTTSRLSQGHPDVNQSKKFMFMCLFSPEKKRRFWKRAVLANVPSFPFWGPGISKSYFSSARVALQGKTSWRKVW